MIIPVNNADIDFMIYRVPLKNGYYYLGASSQVHFIFSSIRNNSLSLHILYSYDLFCFVGNLSLYLYNGNVYVRTCCILLHSRKNLQVFHI